MSDREVRLTARLEDLRGRLAELWDDMPRDPMAERYDRRFYSRLADGALDGVVPEGLHSVQDVLRAIGRTKDALWALQCESAEARRAAAMRAEAEAQLPGQTVILSLFAEPAALAS